MLRFHDDPAGGARTPIIRATRTLAIVALVATAAVAGQVATEAPPVEAQDDTPWTLPETPPRCTRSQADSGDVADCVVAFYHDPADTGWGAPPAPGVGSGWNWKGYTYNGSPALDAWESTVIAANTAPVAGRAPGWLETHVDVQVLFEGFLDEISAKGYRVYDASGYSFRCTNANGGWSCPSGDPRDLSNHAWGLAIDMNAGTNPIRSYAGVDGRTACLTPIQTDMPQWVIRTAEKWGLYWGGYGWNNGCTSTSTQRTVVSRDPPHFEFRGTPSQAAAIAAFNLRNDPSATCFDVVDEQGELVERCTLDGVPQTGWRLPVHVDAPDDAVAALVNLAGTDARTLGSFTIEDCGPRPDGERETTSLQFGPGSAIATLAVAPLSDDDTFCVWRSAPAHSVVDVVAYLTDSGERLWVDPVEPSRLTDTREEPTCDSEGTCLEGPIEAKGIRRIPTNGSSLVNISTTQPESRGFLQVGRCDDVGPDRMFANLNFADENTARGNLALVQESEAGTCVYVHRRTHVVVDEFARLTTDTGYGWQLVEARRIYDSETVLPPRTLVEIDLGTSAPAVAVGITVSESAGRGYATVAPCSEFETNVELGQGAATSSVNYAAGRGATNLALTATDDGSVCLYTHAGGRVTLDLQSELVDDQTFGLSPVTPRRSHDSRL